MSFDRQGPQNLGAVDWPTPKEGALEGEKFLITGVLETIEKTDIIDLIMACSGRMMTVVSPQLTYLVVGREAGPKKIERANEKGIAQIDEGGFFEYLNRKIAQAGLDIKPEPADNHDDIVGDDNKPSKKELKQKKPLKEKKPAARGKRPIKDENDGPANKKAKSAKSGRSAGAKKYIKKLNVKEEPEEVNEEAPVVLNARGRPKRAVRSKRVLQPESEVESGLDDSDADDEYMPEGIKKKTSLIDQLDDE